MIAFMDIQPVNPRQVLVVSIRHAAYLSDLDGSTGGRMFQVAQKVAAALRASGIRCEGVDFFLADGVVAMQEVFHTHLHVIPRFERDGFGPKYGERNFLRLVWTDSANEKLNAIGESLVELPQPKPRKKKKL